MSRDPRDQAPGDRPEHPTTPADGDDAAVGTPAWRGEPPRARQGGTGGVEEVEARLVQERP